MNGNKKSNKHKRTKRFYTVVAMVIVVGMVLSFTVVFVDFLGPTGGTGSASLPEVVAEVNEEEIKKDEFNFHMAQVKAMYEMQGVNLESRENENMLRQVQWDVLQELIDEVLLVQQAEDEGLTVSNDMVQAEYQQILVQFEGDEDALENELSSMNFTPEDLKKVIAQQLTAQQYIQQYKEENIEEEELEVTEEEVENLYEQYSAQMEEMPDYEEIKLQLEEELRQRKVDQVKAILTQELKEESDIEVYM